MNIPMVIIGGLLMFGGLLTWWIPFIGLFGIIGGFLGFILLIVGIAIPSERRQEQIIIQQPPIPPPPQQLSSAQTILAICPQCKNRIPSDSAFCPRCGADLRAK